ncbi:LYPLA2, partial [Symbiodinium pilosum]
VRNRLGIGGLRHRNATAVVAPRRREREATADHEVTILVSEPLRPVLVLNPLWEKPTATVVLLHGLLQSGPMLERLARGLSKGLPFARFVAPTAPSMSSLFGYGPAWFDTTKPSEGRLPEHLEASAKELINVLETEASISGAPTQRLILVGFSAGGALGAYAALRAPFRVGGLALLGSAGLVPLGRAAAGLRTTGIPALQCHGQEDRMVSAATAQESANWLRRQGCD